MNHLIDIHTHIIPGVDDGAETELVSDEMLTRYLENGFDTIIATSHVSIVPEPKYLVSISEGFRRVTQLAENRGITILKGTEVRLSPEVFANNENIGWFGLAGTQYVLVDFPSGAWPHYAESTLFSLQTLGLTPILAHPERYGWGSNNRNTAQDLVDRGILIQVTLGSLVGAFGPNARSVSHELLKSGLVHFTATDAHSAGSRMKTGIKGLHWLRKTYGDEAIETTLSENPRAILTNGNIEPFTAGANRKFWSTAGLRRLLPIS